MQLIKDYIYRFKELWEKPGECRIRIFEGNYVPTVIICSESLNNQGGSITLIAEGLAQEIWHFEGKPEPFIWIEHYPANVSQNGEATFDQVTFVKTPEGKFFTPQWIAMTKEEVEKLVDQPI
jgi:hypothetical protein